MTAAVSEPSRRLAPVRDRIAQCRTQGADRHPHHRCPIILVRGYGWLQPFELLIYDFIHDVGLFLDSPFWAVAAALGWGSLDLFGCSRYQTFARIDLAGLLWLLNGTRLLALTENTATIETKSSARQNYRRKPSEPGRVLAWELADGAPA